MQPAVSAESFDRAQLGALDLTGRHQAGVDGGAVDQHGAGAALALAAALLGASELKVFAQGIEQSLQRRDVDGSLVTGDPKLRLHAMALMMRSGVAGTASSRLPVAAWIALRIAAAGPSIGHSPTPLAPKGPFGYGSSTISTLMGGVSSVVGMM